MKATRLVAFFLAPSSPRPLGVFRIGVSLVLLAQAWSLAGHIQELFGDRGLTPWSITAPLASPWMPRVETWVALARPWGLNARESIQALCCAYALALAALLVGWRTRPAATLAWLLHAVLMNSAPLFIYGVEVFAHISLFYCVVLPVGAAFALDVRAGRTSDAPSAMATLGLRVLQLHLCLVYVSSGVEKALGATWQQGTAVWDAVMQPQFFRFDLTWLAHQPWVSMAASWGTLLVEVGYGVFIWPRQTRLFWVLLTLGLHAGIALFMGLWLFSGIMAVLTFAAFGWEALGAAPRHFARARQRV
ncbi:HTTM domain-containing protein [Archangium primigenium]|uniref:HTTM domain-containing protein n=1 Tax=[Archangium] primigenium TaxID=2792470 RepID=UPI00195C33A2|nr:HTTM domain-containing protein [Archangium primigenium]MBM7113326.1 HTTM domain-containing protein [Archangium primigenium]